MLLDAVDIQNILPYKQPFLFLDGVIDYTKGKNIITHKNLTISEPCFNGHFPNYPIFPGVYIIECVAQSCTLFNNLEQVAFNIKEKSKNHNLNDLSFNEIGILGSVEISFKEALYPGETMRIEVEKTYERFAKAIFEFNVYKNKTVLCASGKIVTGTMKKP